MREKKYFNIKRYRWVISYYNEQLRTKIRWMSMSNNTEQTIIWISFDLDIIRENLELKSDIDKP